MEVPGPSLLIESTDSMMILYTIGLHVSLCLFSGHFHVRIAIHDTRIAYVYYDYYYVPKLQLKSVL